MRKRTKRRRGIPIPTLCEAHGRDNDREYGHGALPIIGFKDGPSERYVYWNAWKATCARIDKHFTAGLHDDPWINLLLEEESAKARQQRAGWWCDWVPARNRKRRLP